ncbi:related to isoamyl alcohol oxidase [Cephalotrichum gorgonifer]|uniref:Related to isoamyl alcohol oxidase n=1 Tax=Cephalotrichum gorgonifer TaxID=2041049 RepID=A0AAE8MUE3_9PEZI|nr:related to isoamyl alcohol oxidase [Cephalotrichum gorgonifer]
MTSLPSLKLPTIALYLVQFLCLAAVPVNGNGGRHHSSRSYKCPAVVAGWFTYDFHTSDPTSIQWNQFSNDSCLPFERYPCDGSGYPAFVVNATEVEHVRRAVKFAGKNDVRLVVKGTGHDFIGRSIAPNSLSIWTHYMKDIEYHKGSFRPRGCRSSIKGNAVTAGAGVQMIDLHDYLDPYGETVVGGGAKSVGVGGYITGGGHSMLSTRNGLAVDQVLEMEVVTPDGDHITANECRNEDIFWAMRGGGGSTFGVLTSVTLRVIPSPKMLHMIFMLGTTSTAPNITDIQALFLSKVPSLSDSGLAGYVWLAKEMVNPAGPDPGPPLLGGIFGMLTLQDTDDEKDMLNLMEPIVEEAAQRFPDSNVTFGPVIEKYGSFQDWYSVYHDNGAAGSSQWLGSRLFGEDTLTGDAGELAARLDRLEDLTGQLMVYMVSGKGVFEAEPRGGGTAVSPAWRTSYVHNTIGEQFAPRNASDDARSREALEAALEVLEEMAPDTGAYVNEAYKYQHDWQQTFWGENYERLLAIKRDVDPKDVFWCHPCVGNERWEEVEGRLCRV